VTKNVRISCGASFMCHQR